MVDIKFSPAQQSAIDAKDKNILVSAAAGSGKTAVLVQRIIKKITDPDNPLDVDRLLVVTFTKAAAAEMKERIGRAILAEIAKSHQNNDSTEKQHYLQKQYMLLQKSYIMTIDSFCNTVVRQNFHKTDIDPEYRIADQNELVTIRDAAMDDLLERHFERFDNDFKIVADACISKLKDDELANLIWSIYNFSRSMPYPDDWLHSCADSYLINRENIWQTKWGGYISHGVEFWLKYAQTIVDKLTRFYAECGEYADCYTNMAEKNRLIIDDYMNILNTCGVEEVLKKMQDGITFPRLSRLKKTDTLTDVNKNILMGFNDSFKDVIRYICKTYSDAGSNSNLEMMKRLYPVVKGITDLVTEFDKIYTSMKLDRQIVDFSDIEHLCLNILVENGKYTSAALEYQQFFDEIIIDEYQDSNYIQECILNAVTGVGDNRNSFFMVGDVKQCIYKFRLANPDLFIDKYNNYAVGKSNAGLLIKLSGNYRSRECVLSVCNFFFKQLMSKDFGGVDYDFESSLIPMGKFPDADENTPISEKSEFYIIDSSKSDDDDADELASLELEAHLAAKRIVELTDTKPIFVFDSVLGKYRKARLSDIAVLLSSPTTSAGIIADVFADYSINISAVGSGSMFDSIEVQTISSILKLIDNPMRDIELIAALHSPIYGIDCNRLAKIKTSSDNGSFYFAVKEYAKGDDELAQSLRTFLADLDYYRSVLEYQPVSSLIQVIYDKSGYSAYVCKLPSGEIRYANLRIFREVALKYEATGGSDLSGFISHIEVLEKNGGVKAAEKSDGSENAVKIMSIHKSKGLEFPIVFVMHMGKRFNKEDIKKSVILDQQLGIGMSYTDPVLRIKSDTVARKVIAKKFERELLSEELRLLYVAFTRAKEKLIITGCCAKPADKILQLGSDISMEEQAINSAKLMNAISAMDWLLPAVIRHNEVFEQFFPQCGHDILFDDVQLETVFLSRADIINEQAEVLKKAFEDAGDFSAEEIAAESDDIIKMLEYSYDGTAKYDIPPTISISEIKKRNMNNFVMPVKINCERPSFMSDKDSTISGTERGTAYHKVFEHLDYSRVLSIDDINGVIDKMVSDSVLSAEEKSEIMAEKLFSFINSPIGERLRNCKKIYRETPFTMIMSADRAFNDSSLKNADMLVRGVIDLYFVEDDGIVLIDYKTDKALDRDYYIKNYKIQLDLYREALEKSTGLNVKETYIFAVNVKNGFIDIQ